MPAFDLQPGNVAVVTGAASGIGLGLAEALVARGLSVVLADLEQPALDAVCAQLRATGGNVLPLVIDVRDAAAVQRLADETLACFGRVDVLCNNAGVFRRYARMWDLTLAEWRWLMDVNLWGVIHGIRSFAPIFVRQGHGHVVNMSSLAGVFTVPFNAPYNAAKHAIVSLSDSLRVEFADCAPQVGVTVVCPGGVESRLYEADRNGPADLPAAAAVAGSTLARGRMMAAVPPSAIASQVLDAIAQGTPLLFTHPGADLLMKDRLEMLAAAAAQANARAGEKTYHQEKHAR